MIAFEQDVGAIGVVDAHRVGVDEAGGAVENFDAIAVVEALPQVDLPIDDGGGLSGELRKRGAAHGPCADREVAPALDEALDDLSKGLRGDRRGVRARASNHRTILDDGYLLTAFGALERGPFATWAGTEDDDVVDFGRSRHDRLVYALPDRGRQWRVTGEPVAGRPSTLMPTGRVADTEPRTPSGG